MNSSVSSINISCIMESSSSISTMAASQSSSMQTSFSRSNYLMDAAEPESVLEPPINTRMECKDTMLARRKRAMFRRALSCEGWGCPSTVSPSTASSNLIRRPRRRRTRPRRSKSNPEQGLEASPSSAALVAGRWESSAVDTAPPSPPPSIRVSSRGCSSEHGPKLSRWDSDDSIDHSRHLSKGPPRRKPSGDCHNYLGADRTKDSLVSLFVGFTSRASLRSSRADMSQEGRVPTRATSTSRKGRGRWNVPKGLGLPGSRGCPCPPRRQLSPVRKANKD